MGCTFGEISILLSGTLKIFNRQSRLAYVVSALNHITHRPVNPFASPVTCHLLAEAQLHPQAPETIPATIFRSNFATLPIHCPRSTPTTVSPCAANVFGYILFAVATTFVPIILHSRADFWSQGRDSNSSQSINLITSNDGHPFALAYRRYHDSSAKRW